MGYENVGGRPEGGGDRRSGRHGRDQDCDDREFYLGPWMIWKSLHTLPRGYRGTLPSVARSRTRAWLIVGVATVFTGGGPATALLRVVGLA